MVHTPCEYHMGDELMKHVFYIVDPIQMDLLLCCYLTIFHASLLPFYILNTQ